MGMDDLFKSISVFQDGLQALAVNNGINAASQQVSEINNSVLGDLQKRQAQEQVARQLALQLTGVGANAQQVQQASGAIMPNQIKDAQDAYLQGTLQGSGELQQAGLEGQKFEEDPKNRLQAQQQKFAHTENALNRISQEKIAGIRASGKGALKTLPTGAVDKISKLEDAITGVDNIVTKFNGSQNLQENVGPWAGKDLIKSWTNSEFADFKAQVGRDFDQYRVAVTGAGAGPKELALLEANRPVLTDTKDAFLKKWQTIQNTMLDVRNRTVKNFARAKYDVSGFDAAMESQAVFDQEKAKDGAAAEAAPGQAPANPLPPGVPEGSKQTSADRGNGPELAYLLPDGNFAFPKAAGTPAPTGSPAPQGTPAPQETPVGVNAAREFAAMSGTPQPMTPPQITASVPSPGIVARVPSPGITGFPSVPKMSTSSSAYEPLPVFGQPNGKKKADVRKKR